VTKVDDIRVTFNDKSEDARRAKGSVVDMDNGVIDIGDSGVANDIHDDIVLRFMMSPNRRLAKEVGKGWISVGHGDKIFLSADAGATVNKTFLVESSATCLSRWRL
jgi:hypothetical protein